MRRTGARAVAAFVALAAALAIAASADAAKPPQAPRGFFGVHVRDLQDTDFGQVRHADAGIVRTGFNYLTLHPSVAAPEHWSHFDAYVAGTAANGMEMLPVVYGVPDWLPGGLGAILGDPVQLAWQTYLTELVDRYGPDGDFWQLHPGLEYHPIRDWQIWNEPNSTVNWEDPDGREFGRFLAGSSRVIHAADPGARVVTAGVVSAPLNPDLQTGAAFLRDMLRLKSVRRSVDVVAVHPYAKNANEAKAAVVEAREALDRAGMDDTPIWISEIGWGSTTPGSSGRRAKRPGPSTLPAERRWNMTPSKQRRMLERTFEMALKNRRSLGIERVIWYQWRDGPDDACRWCESAGLVDADGKPKPLLRSFRRIARP
ncbi:MAG: glycosyl hydrolase [Solirubrobacterales bacterium]